MKMSLKERQALLYQMVPVLFVDARGQIGRDDGDEICSDGDAALTAVIRANMLISEVEKFEFMNGEV